MSNRSELLGSTAQLPPPPPQTPPRQPKTAHASPPKAKRAPRRSRRLVQHRSARRDDQDSGDAPDVLVPDPQVAREFGVSLMTLSRWTDDPKMNFPPPIKPSGRAGGKNFRSRRMLESFKAALVRTAIAQRSAAR
jgi:hypothetical protein